MASTDYDFILTRNELIEEAYRKIGVLSEYQNLTAEQIASGTRKVNLILKEWSEDGVKLWTQIIETSNTVVSQDYLSIPTDNGLAYVDMVHITEDGNDNELMRIDKRDYETIPDKDSAGRPDLFYQDVISNRIYFWPVPDEIYPVRMFGVKKLKDWETEDDTGDLAARWQTAILYALAASLAEDYRLGLREIDDMRSQADRRYRLAMNKEFSRSETRRIKGAFDL
jgi:hypothetical protein